MKKLTSQEVVLVVAVYAWSGFKGKMVTNGYNLVILYSIGLVLDER